MALTVTILYTNTNLPTTPDENIMVINDDDVCSIY